MMNWESLWDSMFGTQEWLGLNMGFWVSMAVVCVVVLIQNIVFWTMKPSNREVKHLNAKR